jgi:hypothetical protein
MLRDIRCSGKGKHMRLRALPKSRFDSCVTDNMVANDLQSHSTGVASHSPQQSLGSHAREDHLFDCQNCVFLN